MVRRKDPFGLCRPLRTRNRNRCTRSRPTRRSGPRRFSLSLVFHYPRHLDGCTWMGIFHTDRSSLPRPTLIQISGARPVERCSTSELCSRYVGGPAALSFRHIDNRPADTGQPGAAESSIRKWLTYLALVIAFCVLIGDAATFVAYFIRGELT